MMTGGTPISGNLQMAFSTQHVASSESMSKGQKAGKRVVQRPTVCPLRGSGNRTLGDALGSFGIGQTCFLFAGATKFDCGMNNHMNNFCHEAMNIYEHMVAWVRVSCNYPEIGKHRCAGRF